MIHTKTGLDTPVFFITQFKFSGKRNQYKQCVQKFITEPSIKLMAERATWLGNDGAHYVRKWEDKDLQDLKNLIDLTVYFISRSLKALRYQEEMVK